MIIPEMQVHILLCTLVVLTVSTVETQIVGGGSRARKAVDNGNIKSQQETTGDNNDVNVDILDTLPEEDIPSLKVSEAEIKNAQHETAAKRRTVLVYSFASLGVLLFVAILYGLWKDPLCCLLLLFCPCCIVLFPCSNMFFKRYEEPRKILQNDVGKYIPGIIYHDDGTMERYQPTVQEMRCLLDVVEKIESV